MTRRTAPPPPPGRRLAATERATWDITYQPAPDEAAIRADERRKAAEEIARAIEVAGAKRCPWCQGLPQGTTHDNTTHQNTHHCMRRHEWPARPVWHDPAAIAREIGGAP